MALLFHVISRENKSCVELLLHPTMGNGVYAMPPIIGRFAPTPSGKLHLGNILCAMLAYLSARHEGGKFLLRIEDLDLPRCPAVLSNQVIADLQWLGFTWDEAPLWQSLRSDVYQQALDQLTDAGLTYPCFCTRAQLHASAAPNLGDTQFVYAGTCRSLSPAERAALYAIRKPALRLHVPDETITFTDGLFGVTSEHLANDCGDFILKRSDGLFGYQLAVVVDDAACGVNQVVRGRDILSATPRQLSLQRALGLSQPAYIHIPLLMDSDGRRLAKRDHDLDLSQLARSFNPNELLGMLAFTAGLLDEPEPLSLEQLIPRFDWGRIPTHDLCLPDQFIRKARRLTV